MAALRAAEQQAASELSQEEQQLAGLIDDFVQTMTRHGIESQPYFTFAATARERLKWTKTVRVHEHRWGPPRGRYWLLQRGGKDRMGLGVTSDRRLIPITFECVRPAGSRRGSYEHRYDIHISPEAAPYLRNVEYAATSTGESVTGMFVDLHLFAAAAKSAIDGSSGRSRGFTA